MSVLAHVLESANWPGERMKKRPEAYINSRKSAWGELSVTLTL